MTLDTVRGYLLEQRDDFLNVGLQAAVSFTTNYSDPGEAQERIVAEGWRTYFEELILEMQSLLILDEEALKETLEAEREALGLVIEKVNDAIQDGFPGRTRDYSFEGRFLLEQMIGWLEIERRSIDIILDEI